jgi:molybdenum cofactor cytidylyltransferase
MGEIWAIILAAGESKRMGSQKMLLPFHGQTMIETVISNVKESEAGKIIVVLGSEREHLVSLAEMLDVRYCYNDKYKDGMLSSVQCGFDNLPADYRAAMVFQGDQPLITKNVINSVIDKYLNAENGIVIPVYKKRRGHPILIDRKYHSEIGKLSPVKGLRSLAEKFSDDVLEIETDESGIMRDFDTIAQYKRGVNII